MSKRVFTGFSCPKEMQDWIYAEAQRQNRSASNLIQTILLKEKERLEREAEKSQEIAEQIKSSKVIHRSWGEPD